MSQNPVETFLHEADDLLAQIEEVSVDLNVNDPEAESINQLFRAFHTIKGSGSMFGFDAVAAFTHHVETTLDYVRTGELDMSSQLLDLILAARDHIKLLFDNDGRSPAEIEDAGKKIIAALQRLNNSNAELLESSAAPGNTVDASQGSMVTWNIRFRPALNLMAGGLNPLALLNELRGLGVCTVTGHSTAVPSLNLIQSDGLYFFWDITLTSDCGLDAIKDVFIFVDDESEILISPAEQNGAERLLPDQVPLPQEATQEKAARMPSDSSKEATAGRMSSKDSTVRVPAAKLDRLVNLVGELVMNQSRLTQAASEVNAPGLAEPVEEIERLVSELRDNVLGIRMMPIGVTFGKFKRLVHDLSGELGKEIDLVTEGAETELDKTVLDQISDPLVHLIRNSIDHGIETVEERLQSGKPARGRLRLTALHTGSNVVVTIEDDGSGLNTSRILAKAVEKQLISPDATLSEKEIFNLIFLPGFSTAKEITSISGRGVGMDVVKKQIEQLRGSIGITSELGKGTTIALTLPLTLAIIDGLLVDIGKDQYIIPMSLVTENVELHRTDRLRGNGRNVIPVRGELIPYVQLREVFHINGQQPDVEKIVIVNLEGQRAGLVVDRVLGSHQTVIQSLGRFYENIGLFSGATIMGDGRVALILDAAGLIRHVDEINQLRLAS